MLVNSQSRRFSVTIVVNRTIWAGLWVMFSLLGAVFATNSAATADPETDTAPIQVFAFGDSLTAGYGLGPGEGFVPQLESWLAGALEKPVEVVNGGVSGDTSSGGRGRLEWGLGDFGAQGPDLVILELGANDGLRGINPALTRTNIDVMLKTLTDRNIPVLLTGMLAPPNLGTDYGADFNTIYPDLAEKYGVTLYPFFLDGVAADPALNQEDGIHPTKEGVAIIVGRLGPVVLDVLRGGSASSR